MIGNRFEIVCHASDLSIEKIEKVLSCYDEIEKYAYIFHDKDISKPHCHIYIDLGGKRLDSKIISIWFGIPLSFISEIKKGTEEDILFYFVHANNQNLFQYGFSEIHKNF